MSSNDEGRFLPESGKPGRRGERFIHKVLQQAGKAGAKSLSKPSASAPGKIGQQPGARLGRGHVAARFAGQGLGANARRVAIKARLVNLAKAGARSTITHLRYIEREGVNRQSGPGQAYGPATDTADLDAFRERGQRDRHQFRFIVSPEDAEQLDDLRTYTRHLMLRMEADLGTRLDWVAVDHWNTDNPHTHVVLSGKDELGKDLIIARDYIAHGMRERASTLATEWLGPRTELEIRHALGREVTQERWTSLDRTLQREATEGQLTPASLAHPHLQAQRQLLVGRLQHLQRMGLAAESTPGTWALQPAAEPTLRALGERGDIIRTLQRAMGDQLRELAIHTLGQTDSARPTVVGRVAAKGLADELYDKGYLVIDGTDGKAHYVPLPARTELEQIPVGAIVEARTADAPRAADRRISELSQSGLYRSDQHLATLQREGATGPDAAEQVKTHLRRLEALRRAGIVERLTDGVWRVPADLPERGKQFDAENLEAQGSNLTVALKSHLPLQQQTRVIGATWLDQQLINGERSARGAGGLADLGFGAEAKAALSLRTAFLVEQGLARQQGGRTVLARNLLATLRSRELAAVGQRIASETGRFHRPLVKGQSARGVIRRTVQLASGRFAMLDDGVGFSLVPWRPTLEARLGQQVTATVRGGNTNFEWQRSRGIGL
ncbi:relaxase/mobilization nuclease and DUF3363 domain-containing protein [Hydrogenophaga sp.]|uniref:relaxase/mobilization nuclease and DUF3363 domain-containing protein n=1 Tax=Hydrogenophaga sp. TaxID=1904254 RepID=UPI002734A03A|nr:relaxase/mobilization nuclease and DUF3363 domain-containing protein [Hydrogenophaga sp.]MDP3885477.1 relaxase/mobilization nuclease and DUF3363 domain-containing protein [Hydrogenophaga sp.]